MAFVHKSFVSFKTGCSVKRSLTGTALIFADAMQSFPVQHERLVPRKPFSTVLTCHNMSSLSLVANGRSRRSMMFHGALKGLDVMLKFLIMTDIIPGLHRMHITI